MFRWLSPGLRAAPAATVSDANALVAAANARKFLAERIAK